MNDPTKSGHAALKIDFENAFNTIDRGAIRNELLSSFPGIARWFDFCYAQPSHLFCQNRILPFPSAQGVQQGDPLGPLLFALGIRRLCGKVHALGNSPPNQTRPPPLDSGGGGGTPSSPAEPAGPAPSPPQQQQPQPRPRPRRQLRPEHPPGCFLCGTLTMGCCSDHPTSLMRLGKPSGRRPPK